MTHAHNEKWRLCLTYLPKPKWRHLGLVAACTHCGNLYVARVLGRYGSPLWRPIKEENE